ncbi:cation transport ATPase [Rhizobium sp. BK275]|uniref:hypothetical protein n=1 Tax=Rhizobium sp. BK275 TaxID=2587077 RepID=UPI00161EFCFD|nr:hypothetical protein [Rhizobium sp. BK275]MBB3390611.1 cation transport ATPase [Rhizobium sp. BK275]
MIGATLNRSGMLRFRATQVGKDTALSQIIRMVEQAQGSRWLASPKTTWTDCRA